MERKRRGVLAVLPVAVFFVVCAVVLAVMGVPVFLIAMALPPMAAFGALAWVFAVEQPAEP
jgi:hypothetical protein